VNFVEQIQESDLCETNTEPRKSTATGAQSKPGRVVAVAFDRQVSERWGSRRNQEAMGRGDTRYVIRRTGKKVCEQE
jgi:hypothetical protein